MGNSELVVTLAHYEPGTVHYADYIGGDSSGTGVFDVAELCPTCTTVNVAVLP